MLNIALALLSVMPADVTPPPPESVWAEALRRDVEDFHAMIASSHPGPVDPENPQFAVEMEAARALALGRARTANSYEDWYFGLMEYQASFNDGHLALHEFAELGHNWRDAWPGFVTGLEIGPDGSDRHVVRLNDEPSAPPEGAALIGCDGRPAVDLAAEVVGRRTGRWMLRARRARFGGELFIDRGNPYVSRPRSCTFDVDGRAQTYALAWRPMTTGLRERAQRVTQPARFTAPIGIRDWTGGVWISLGGFDANPAGPDHARLNALQVAVEAEAGRIRNAPRVVFDLRGNNGGSSAWIDALARTLWGDAWVTLKSPGPLAVDWRVSSASLATIEGYKSRAVGEPEAMSRLGAIIDGLTQASSENEPFWRQAFESGTAPRDTPQALMQTRVFVLTDYGCASACLDAVDLLLALGAVQIGEETSADTVYMEARSERLPSDRATAVIPMKVYRGRIRGSNVPAVPQAFWSGAMSDTAGLESFVGGL